MGSFKSTILTKKAHALMAKLTAGTATSLFTKIRSSNHDYSALTASQLEVLTTLEGIKQEVSVSDVKRINDASVKVTGTLVNTKLTEGYYIKAIGLYAQDPDEGEILYSITVAIESDWMPPFNNISSASALYELVTTVSNAANVSIEVDPNATVAITTFNEFKEQVVSQLSEKANYYTDKRLNNDFILAPCFVKKDIEGNYFKDVMYLSLDGLDFYKICDYGNDKQFTDKPVGVDVSTIFKDGYFYQAVDYIKYPFEAFMTASGYFLGGNAIQIRKTQDFINYEFIEVDIPRNYLQVGGADFYIENDVVYIVLSLSECNLTYVNATDGKTQYVKHTYIIESTDFINWSAPKLINLGMNNEIDPFLTKENGYYYLFVKNEVTGKITQFKSSSIDSGYAQINILDAESSAVLEGPSLVKLNGGFFLYADAPLVGMRVFYSDDIEKWSNISSTRNSNNEILKQFTPLVIKTDESRNAIKSFIKDLGVDFNLNYTFTRKRLVMLQRDYDNLILYPDCQYMVESTLNKTITISGYNKDLLQNGDKCSFVMNTINANAKLILQNNPSDLAYFHTMTFKSGLGDLIFNIENTPIGLFSDFRNMSEQSIMPSSTSVDLTSNFSTSGKTYVAPTDGWLLLNLSTTGNGEYVNVAWQNIGGSIHVGVFHYPGFPCAFIPLSSGQTYAVNYTVTSITSAKFFKSKSAL